MSFFSALQLSVGVSLFIFGMLLIKYSLKENYGNKLKKFLSDFTGNRFSAVLTGAFVTFAMQSSSASSVLTAAFVDSGYLSLYKAFWIIVGANAGTAFTGLVTALDMTKSAPVLCVVGVVLISFCKSKKNVGAGIMLTGMGLLFVGMTFMGDAVSAVSESAFFAEVLTMCSSPLTGLLAGTLFTALIQSSSAVTALLQTLAFEGIIGIRHAYYIILGSNIGTCATCAVSCIGLSKGAKYVSYMHIIYNAAGSLGFLLLAEVFPLPEYISSFAGDNIKASIAFINIFFNVATALLSLVLPIKEKKNTQSRICAA